MDESRRCTATSKQSGERCKRAAIVGGTVCKIHGGGAPHVKAAAAQRVEQARVLGEVGALMAQVESELGEAATIDGLVSAVRTAEVMALVWRRQVEQLELDRRKGRALYGPNHLGDQAPDVAVNELHRWTKLHADLCKAALDAGVEERRVQIESSQAAVIAGVLRSFAGLVEEALPEGARELFRSSWPSWARQALEVGEVDGKGNGHG